MIVKLKDSKYDFDGIAECVLILYNSDYMVYGLNGKLTKGFEIKLSHDPELWLAGAYSIEQIEILIGDEFVSLVDFE